MEISQDGFKTTKGMDGSIHLLFDSNKSKKCCEFALRQGIKIVSLYPGIYHANDLKPILPLKDFIEGILLDDKVDYSEIYSFSNLLFLSVPDNKRNTVNLSLFSKLEILSCSFSLRLKGLETCNNLKKLSISNFKPQSKDLTALTTLPNLESLSLIKTDITSLQGIEHLNYLKRLEIFGASKLEIIAPIQALANNLAEIEVEHAKKIKDFEILGKLQFLKKIILSESGEIKSLAFVKKLPLLEFLSFWGTNVLDGNIKYCEGINYVSFDNKRHYTHKSEQFKK